MNDKTIIEFGFRIIWRIMGISEGVIRLGLRLRRITPSSISIILHKILSIIHKLLNAINPHFCVLRPLNIFFADVCSQTPTVCYLSRCYQFQVSYSSLKSWPSHYWRLGPYHHQNERMYGRQIGSTWLPPFEAWLNFGCSTSSIVHSAFAANIFQVVAFKR